MKLRGACVLLTLGDGEQHNGILQRIHAVPGIRNDEQVARGAVPARSTGGQAHPATQNMNGRLTGDGPSSRCLEAGLLAVCVQRRWRYVQLAYRDGRLGVIREGRRVSNDLRQVGRAEPTNQNAP
jgi:hypothetical protein